MLEGGRQTRKSKLYIYKYKYSNNLKIRYVCIFIYLSVSVLIAAEVLMMRCSARPTLLIEGVGAKFVARAQHQVTFVTHWAAIWPALVKCRLRTDCLDLSSFGPLPTRHYPASSWQQLGSKIDSALSELYWNQVGAIKALESVAAGKPSETAQDGRASLLARKR